MNPDALTAGPARNAHPPVPGPARPGGPVRWHHDGLIVNGMPYATRHPMPMELREGTVSASEAMGLTAQQSLASRAAHELGHALVWLAGGLCVSYVTIETDADGARGGHAVAQPTGTPDESHVLGVGTAAGERAEDRWLRETGLWTPDRAAVVEAAACSDRAYVLEHTTPRPTFGTGGPDYALLHDMADQALDQIWQQLLHVLPILVRERGLTGWQLAGNTGLPFPPAPPREQR